MASFERTLKLLSQFCDAQQDSLEVDSLAASTSAAAAASRVTSVSVVAVEQLLADNGKWRSLASELAKHVADLQVCSRASLTRDLRARALANAGGGFLLLSCFARCCSF